MSSLPPYNPPPTQRRLWLVNRDSSLAELATLVDSTRGALRVDADDVVELRSRLESTPGDVIVVAAEEVLQSLVLELIGGQPGTARLRFVPGAMSQVQILPDRAVVRHLNLGLEL